MAVIFQAIDWNYYHEETLDDETCPQYVIRIFGRTLEDKTISVKVNNFEPFFYVKIPDTWRQHVINKYIELIKYKVYPKIYKNSLTRYKTVERHEFYGFTNYKLFNFIRLTFNNYNGMRAFERAIKQKITHSLLGNTPFKAKIYESNIEPLLRCMHIRKLDACGWIEINKYDKLKSVVINNTEIKKSYCDINIETDWQNLNRYENNLISKFVIASFDIECTSGDGSFPEASRDSDKVIQIGTTFSRYGESECFYQHIITLGSCAEVEGTTVESYENENEIFIAWTNLLKRMNPDIITGYNILGFDFRYLYERTQNINIDINSDFSQLSRIYNEKCKFVEKQLSSSALGDNILKYYETPGRVQIDLMKVIQRDYKLESYKLDSVAAYFIKENIIKIEYDEKIKTTTIYTKTTNGLKTGKFITINYNDGLSNNEYADGRKFEIIELKETLIKIKEYINIDILKMDIYSVYWTQSKDDISPPQLFKLFKGDKYDRAVIAKYCIQDCALCNILMSKLQIINNHVGMSNVCSVPLSYLFSRGQSIKVFSLVSKKCREKNHLIPALKKKKFIDKLNPNPNVNKYKYESSDSDSQDDTVGYEGATVFDPIKGAHFEPIAVLDYASLYPRSMIYKNLSHETIVLDEQYLNLPGYIYRDITYNNNDETTQTCTFVQKKSNTNENNHGIPGILPEILLYLLQERTNTKKKMKNEKNKFIRDILDGLQLAYKLTCNSLYGSCGASISNIYLKEVAASTTATGREMLLFAKDFIEKDMNYICNYISNKSDKKYQNYMEKLYMNVNSDKFINENYKNKQEFFTYIYEKIDDILYNKKISPHIIYGDTDSVFFSLKLVDKITNQKQIDIDKQTNKKDALIMSIKIGDISSILMSLVLPYPMNIEYEKTLYPFCIITKKRYVGNLYEYDPDKYVQKSMGIVLKRRDNANIVKIICGGIIKEILNNHSAKGAVEFTKKTLYDIFTQQYPMNKFIITKTLRDKYVDRTRMVHAVLADRIAKREPGNKPVPSDRIPYVYVVTPGIVKLQGERVEHPEYIKTNNLKIDYLFYITNQIMKPCVQFLELLVDNPENIFKHYTNIQENINKGLKPVNYYIKNINKENINNENGNEHGLNINDDLFDIKIKKARKNKKK
jgi:DNA polymerase elongation subunit (family B)